MTNTPVFIPPTCGSRIRTCPHCHGELPDEATTVLFFFLLAIGVLLFIVQAGTFMMGLEESGYSNQSDNGCKMWPEKRYDYLIPAYKLGCIAGEYLRADLNK